MQLWQIFNDETIVNFGCTTSHCNGEQRKIYQTQHYSVRFVVLILFFFLIVRDFSFFLIRIKICFPWSKGAVHFSDPSNTLLLEMRFVCQNAPGHIFTSLIKILVRYGLGKDKKTGKNLTMDGQRASSIEVLNRKGSWMGQELWRSAKSLYLKFIPRLSEHVLQRSTAEFWHFGLHICCKR